MTDFTHPAELTGTAKRLAAKMEAAGFEVHSARYPAHGFLGHRTPREDDGATVRVVGRRRASCGLLEVDASWHGTRPAEVVLHFAGWPPRTSNVTEAQKEVVAAGQALGEA